MEVLSIKGGVEGVEEVEEVEEVEVASATLPLHGLVSRGYYCFNAAF